MTLSEIAIQLNYGVAHLSSQFKKITGYTTQFKQLKIIRGNRLMDYKSYKVYHNCVTK
jgi:YesN/AraC family two-component response regulator